MVLYDANYVKMDEVRSDKEGKFDFGQVDCENKYRIRTEIEAYSANEIAVLRLKLQEIQILQ